MFQLEKTLKALANKRRLAIIKYLKDEGPASVTDIAATIKLSFRSTSRHLNVLFAADILGKEQQSLQVYYFIVSKPDPLTRYILSIG